MPAYTADGQLVPRKPIFEQKVTNLVDQLMEKADLIKEFIHKKRQGQLNLNLIGRIGIYTPALNATITRYKKHFQQTSKSTSTAQMIKKPRKYRLKSDKLEQNRLKREALRQEKQAVAAAKTAAKMRLNKAKSAGRIKQKKIRHIISTGLSPVKQKDALANFNDLVSKKNETKQAKKNEIKRMEALEKKNKTKKAPKLKINHFFNNLDCDSNTNQSEPSEASNTTNNCNAITNDGSTNSSTSQSTQAAPKSYRQNHIRNLINDTSHLEAAEQRSNQSSAHKQPVKTLKKRGRKKKTLSPECEAKRSKKVHVDIIQPVTVSKSVDNQQMKSAKEVKIGVFEKSMLGELSPLVVAFKDVPDGERVPCVVEQQSLFKFMYLLKKTDANSKYFYKYTIIRSSRLGKYVGIKPFSGQLTSEYLNEKRLEAVEKILDQVFKSKPS